MSSKGGDASNVASGAKTTSATGAAAVAGSSALAAGIIAAAGSGPDAATGTTSESGVGATLVGNTQANLEDDKKISDLDRELKQTEAKIDNLKQNQVMLQVTLFIMNQFKLQNFKMLVMKMT